MPLNQLPLQPDLAGYPPVPQLQPVEGGGSFLQSSMYNPQQQQALQNLLQMGGQKLAQPTAGFQPFEERARQQFQTQTVPSIAERFTALGGGQRSTGFQQALGQAGSDLESQLAGLRSQYGQQQEQQGLNFLQAGLQPQYNQAYYQPTEIGATLANQGVGAGMDLVKAFLSAPGTSFKEKLGNVFGMGGSVAGAALEPLAQKAGEYAGQVLAPNAPGAAQKLAQATVPAAAGGLALGAATKAAGAPAMAAAAPAATAALAAKTGAATGIGAAAPTAAAAAVPGLEASIAPSLASFGAVAMPAAVLGLLAYGLYQTFGPEEAAGQRNNPVAEGEYRTPEGNIVRSEGKKLREYDKNGKVIREQIYTGLPTKSIKYGSAYNIGKGAFKGIELQPVTKKGAK